MPPRADRAARHDDPVGAIGQTSSLLAEPGHAGRRIALIAALILVATVLHYGINLQEGAVHDILTRSYYLPIVLAGLWFGARGGFVAAVVVTVVFFPHALHGWNAPYTFVFRFIEILMYFVMGILTGLLSSRTTRALAAERTARVERERALHDKAEAYDELKERTAEVFELERQLRRADRLAALGKLSAGLAHEIRNPLGSIRTAVEVLADRADRSAEVHDRDTAELYGVVLEETERLNRTLTAFLDFARSERNLAGDEPRRANLAHAVQQTVGLLQPQLGRRHVTVEIEAAELDVDLAIAPSHLTQVVLNLLLNAAEAVGDGGRVELRSAAAPGGRAAFSVEDDGPGLPPELGDRVFDPFVSTKQGGTGLGLSVVARLVDSYGGSVDAGRGDTGGARFVVVLPRVTG